MVVAVGAMAHGDMAPTGAVHVVVVFAVRMGAVHRCGPLGLGAARGACS